MALVIAGILMVLVVVAGFVVRSRRRKREVERHSISVDQLLQLKKDGRDFLLFDVRLPLDLLAHTETIPGAIRLPPKEVEARANAISREKDIVIYGTCLDNRTLRLVVQLTERLKFCRLKMLTGGFEGWKDRGLPVEAYTKVFHLDTATEPM
jgi:rhodanese-related sulfurtransferase